MATASHNPPFRAEHIGSLLRPPELQKARADQSAGKISAAELSKVQDESIRKAVKLQEDAGLQSITDGEFRRDVFYTDFFCRGLGGVTVYEESEQMAFVDNEGRKVSVPLIKVTARMRWSAPIHVDDFRFVSALTSHTPKITMPTPNTIQFAAGRGNISKEAYPDIDQAIEDVVDAYHKELRALSEAGCRYVQIDEVPLAMLCDERTRGQMRQRGEDPEKLIHESFPAVINRALAGRPKSMRIGMHLCRGNNQSGWLTEGGYDPIADTLFNKINVDCYFLEYDSPRAGNFEPLRLLPKHKTAVLGLVSSKLGQAESKDVLKRRIDEAAKYVDLDRLAISPQCGFASTAPGNRLTAEQQAAKLRLVVDVAREVWG
ncbi:MAG: 5-methyltetrahydropteroyltriglutamate--homocysteine S-methyltransferase [Candidatus Binataceae bacterium]